MKVDTKDQAFSACMRQQSEWFTLRDLFRDSPGEGLTVDADSCRMIAMLAERMAILSGQIAAFVMPIAAPEAANDAGNSPAGAA